MRRTLASLGGAAALLTASAAGALTFTSTTNLAIPDNNPIGITNGIDTTSGFGGAGTVTSVSIQIAISHSYVGDLAIELTSPSGTELQILARPGSTAGNEATGAPFGDSSNASAANVLTFQDGAATPAESLGAGLGNGGTVPASSYSPSPDGWATDIAAFSGFAGEAASGIWTLKVADYAAADTGTLASWSLTVDVIVVPEPATGLLLALGLIAIWSRSRARRINSPERG